MFLQRRLFVCVMCFMSFFFPAFPSASGGRQMGDGRWAVGGGGERQGEWRENCWSS